MATTREQGERSDKIGELGEVACRGAFTRNDMVWNPVQRDRAGFDATVSWVSGTESTGVPFALPARFFALAQVKASDDLSKSRPYLTLQRALNLIDHHGPSFVLLLDFKGGLDVADCEVLHVAGEFVRLVYERVASATNEELSKQRITVSQAFTKTLKLDEVPRYASATAGPSPAEYEKRKLTENASLRAAAKVDAAVLRAVFPREHHEKELAELALGLRDKLELNPVGDVSLQVRGNIGTYSDTTLVLSAIKGTPISVEVLDQPVPLAFRGRAFSTRAMFPWLAEELDETRIAGAVLDIRLKGTAQKFGMTFPLPEVGAEHDIGSLGAEAAVFLAADHALRLTEGRLRLAFVADGKRAESSFGGKGPGTLTERVRAIVELYATAGELVRRFADRAIVSRPALLMQQATALQAAALFLSPVVARDLQASFQDDQPPPEGSSYGVPLVSRCIVGDTIFVLAGFVRGTLVRDESRPGWQRLSTPFVDQCLGHAEAYLATPVQRAELDRRVDAALDRRADELGGYLATERLGSAVY